MHETRRIEDEARMAAPFERRPHHGRSGRHELRKGAHHDAGRPEHSVDSERRRGVADLDDEGARCRRGPRGLFWRTEDATERPERDALRVEEYRIALGAPDDQLRCDADGTAHGIEWDGRRDVGRLDQERLE